jgi:hypothetical protein
MVSAERPERDAGDDDDFVVARVRERPEPDRRGPSPFAVEPADAGRRVRPGLGVEVEAEGDDDLSADGRPPRARCGFATRS